MEDLGIGIFLELRHIGPTRPLKTGLAASGRAARLPAPLCPSGEMVDAVDSKSLFFGFRQ